MLRLGQLRESLRSSLWFVPALCVLAAIALVAAPGPRRPAVDQPVALRRRRRERQDPAVHARRLDDHLPRSDLLDHHGGVAAHQFAVLPAGAPDLPPRPVRASGRSASSSPRSSTSCWSSGRSGGRVATSSSSSRARRSRSRSCCSCSASEPSSPTSTTWPNRSARRTSSSRWPRRRVRSSSSGPDSMAPSPPSGTTVPPSCGERGGRSPHPVTASCSPSTWTDSSDSVPSTRCSSRWHLGSATTSPRAQSCSSCAPTERTRTGSTRTGSARTWPLRCRRVSASAATEPCSRTWRSDSANSSTSVCVPCPRA